jgi:NADP-dependent 3-hydroxy acid dehydrogenase YdfG
MMEVNYMGGVSILNIIAMDESNKNLERIIGLSSLSGVRGRKSNFVYGSTKAAFTQYLAGLRQELASRKK